MGLELELLGDELNELSPTEEGSALVRVVGGPVLPYQALAVPIEPDRSYPRLTASVAPADGGWVTRVTFNPDGERLPPGDYPVFVHVRSGAVQDGCVVRFAVRRHPCLRVTPVPAVTWDPITSTGTLQLNLVNCGNVDLDVDLAVEVKDRHLAVRRPKAKVKVSDGDVTWSTAVSLPDGEIHTDIGVDTDIVVIARAPGVQPVRSPARLASAQPTPAPAPVIPPSPVDPDTGRGGRAWLVVAVMAGAIAVAGALDGGGRSVASDGGVTVTATDGTEVDGPTVTGGPTTDGAGDTEQSDTDPTKGTVTTENDTTHPSEPDPAPAEAKLVADDGAEREVSADVGARVEAVFSIRNDGGRPAEVKVSLGGTAQDQFTLPGQGCDGALEPGASCSVQVLFHPTSAGSYSAEVVVAEGTAGGSLQLTVTGTGNKPALPDLYVRLPDEPGDADCPAGATECVTFTVGNKGAGAAPRAKVRVTTPGGSSSLDVPALEPKAEKQLVAVVRQLCSSDCSLAVVVDPDGLVPESDERNNKAGWERIG